MFSKLMASFILIILIISSFHIITNSIYKQNMEGEITKNASEKFNTVVKEFEQCFNDVENKMLLDFYIEYSGMLKSPKNHNYDNTLMIKKMNKYLLIYPYLKDFIVYIRNFDYVITLNSTFEKKAFFERFYASSYYTEDFWQDEMKKNFMYRVYPLKEFSISGWPNKSQSQFLMPIVLKHITNTDFILIALMDMKQFAAGLDTEFIKDFYIYGKDGARMYPEVNSAGEPAGAFINNIIYENESSGYHKVENGYLFTYKSAANALTYYKYYPDTVIRNQINKTNRLMTVIIGIAMFFSVLLSIYIVKKFNNPVKHIYRLIKGSKDATDTGRDIIDLKNIKDRVAGIISQNMNYAKDIDEKNSLLKNYFWQTRLKNILLKPDEAAGNPMEFTSYAVVLFKIHYRNAYYLNIGKKVNEGVYILKDLIHVYLYEQFNDAVTFQMDAMQIISIVDVKTDGVPLDVRMEEIVKKLMNEDDYVYFTVVYSGVYYNSSELHEVYEKVLKTLKYRKLREKTQALSENALNKKPGGFHFSRDQQEQFTNLLPNGRKDECLQLIDGVFEYNLRKETNEFCIYLLYVQVVDCCSNVLMQLYNEIPGDLPFAGDYFNPVQCESADDYKKKYESVITGCIDYIGKNMKQNDHIVDYVKSYIGENYASDLSVDILADKLKISRTYLSRYFKNNTGMNLSDYLNAYRMKKACTLLQDSFLMIKDIAPRVGIYNISTFMRLFKSYTGKTPNDYRKSSIL